MEEHEKKRRENTLRRTKKIKSNKYFMHCYRKYGLRCFLFL